MNWLRGNVAVAGLALSLGAGALGGYVKVRDLFAQVAEMKQEVAQVKALPARVDSLTFASKLNQMWFLCTQVYERPADWCRPRYLQAATTGVFPNWAQVGPPDSTAAR